MTKRMFLDFWMVILVTPWICRKPSLDIAWGHSGLRPGQQPQRSPVGAGGGGGGALPGSRGLCHRLPGTLCGPPQLAPRVYKRALAPG